jgi:hypothetical protein
MYTEYEEESIDTERDHMVMKITRAVVVEDHRKNKAISNS